MMDDSSDSYISSLGLFSSLKNDPEQEILLNVSLPSESKEEDDEVWFAKKKIKNRQLDHGVIRRRMNGFQTYFAILKGYTTMSIFVLPLGFKEGGWLFSALVLIAACVLITVSVVKIINVAQKAKIYNYPDLVEYCFGKSVRSLI